MANTEYNSVLSGAGAVLKGLLLAALEGRGSYVIKDAENPTTLTPGNATYLKFMGIDFWYDSTDSTTTHDGVTCCVTADGKRFKTFNFAGPTVKFFKVTSRILTAPPSSPAIGDAYIVAVGATGLWAAKDKYIATWTARGWMFVVPATYDIALVVTENLLYNYAVSAAWVAGVPAINNGPNSIGPSMIKYGRMGFWATNQTTNAPPGSPADGDIYIIGSAPTGAWSGFSQYIAVYETSAFVLYPPYIGARCFDRALKVLLIYYDGIWNSQASFDFLAPKIIGSAVFVSVQLGTAYSYTRAGNVVTATLAAHGMSTGHYIQVAGGGSAPTGALTPLLFAKITVIDANTFTFLDTASGATSGNFYRTLWVKQMYGFTAASHTANGTVIFTFTTARPTIDYIATGVGATNAASSALFLSFLKAGATITSYTFNSSLTLTDSYECNLLVMQ